MHQRKSKIIFIYFFLLIIVSSISNKFVDNSKSIKIKNINVLGLESKDNQIILDKIKYLKLENIFSINKNEILKILNSNSLIESYEIFKIYPSTINIIIKKTEFLAKINDNGKIFLIGSNGKLIPTVKPYKDLPFIFGNPKIDEFLKFKQIIDNSKFSYNQIENLYFYQSKRWDLKLKENILLKLPNDFSNKTLDTLYEFLEEYNVKNFTIIDSRIKNQIILNE
tara:strand:+ start:2033 stop:2704 length:672 start_codon:yes stop_codon:yes gene_type:complete